MKKYLAAGLMAAGVLAGCGGPSNHKVGQAVGDVKVLACAVRPNGSAAASIQVTNRGHHVATYLIIMVISGPGVRATASTSANNLAPGRSVDEQAISGSAVRAGVPLTCKVSSLLRTPALTPTPPG